MTAPAPPSLVAVVCAPSAPPALRDAAVAWVATLDPARVALLCDRVTVLAGVVAEEAERRGIGAAWWFGEGACWRQRGIAGAAVFGVAAEARAARAMGVRVREWDSMGVACG